VSAAYDEALAALESIGEQASAADARTAAEYRLFCLLALDRKADARRAIETMLTADPFHRLPEGQTSPRIGAFFDDVRRQIFPALVQRTYSDAKAAFDRKDPTAAARFEDALSLLNDPDAVTIAGAADLRIVATGFRDLSIATLSRRAPDQSQSRPLAVAPRPPDTSLRASTQEEPRAAPPISERGKGLVPPVALFQRMPEWQPASSIEQRRSYNGTLEVTIDASGKVTSAKMLRPINPRYDAELLKAAKSWQFRPATMNGVPTTYVKTVDIQLQPN
jgi:TonB family protein